MRERERGGGGWGGGGGAERAGMTSTFDFDFIEQKISGRGPVCQSVPATVLHKTDFQHHHHSSLHPSRGRGGAALLNAAPAVSTSDGLGQGRGSWQSSSLSPPLVVMGKGLGRSKALPGLHL